MWKDTRTAFSWSPKKTDIIKTPRYLHDMRGVFLVYAIFRTGRTYFQNRAASW